MLGQAELSEIESMQQRMDMTTLRELMRVFSDKGKKERIGWKSTGERKIQRHHGIRGVL